MVYQINYEDVSKDKFYEELNKRLETYMPYTKYYPQTKEEVIEDLQKDRKITLFEYEDERFRGSLVIKDRITFIACEEQIMEMAYVIEESEYDACDCDSIQVALALWNAGYRKVGE